jgi:SAM-dependent methyltransferase
LRLKSVLELPAGFDLYQRLVGAPGSKRRFVDEFVRPEPGQRVLDLGCGTGALFGFMPEGVRYVGVDLDAGYVAAARARYGEPAEFIHGDATTYAPDGDFDVAICYGVVHHLADEQARGLIRVARAARRFVAAEPCSTPEAGAFESFLMRSDRGRHVRTEDGYARLAREAFRLVESRLVPGTYRIPYTLVVLNCT